MFESYDDIIIISIDELMEMLDIGKNYAYTLLRSSEVKSFKIGKVYKIPKICVQQYIQNKAELK